MAGLFFNSLYHPDSILLAGAGFGIEASLIAIIGYTLACLTLALFTEEITLVFLERDKGGGSV